MKKLLVGLFAAVLLVGSPLSLTACGSASSGSTSSNDVKMQYISPDDLGKAITDKDDSYLVVDVRKADDYKAGHIPGAISADMDKAKGGDVSDGKSTMGAALKEATGSEKGEGRKLVLVCYSGKSYAQAGTNVLSGLGANMGEVYTLEGGMKAWTGETSTN